MRRTIAVVTLALVMATTTPGAIAGETMSASYDLPGGAIRLSPGACSALTCGPAVSINFSVCDDDIIDDGDGLCTPVDQMVDPEDDGWVHVGVLLGQSDCGDCYTEFLVTVTDTLPTSTYYEFCVITQHQDGRGYGDSWCGEDPDCISGVDPAACDDIVDPRARGCGSQTVSSTVLAGGPVNRMTGFVWASHVQEDTGNVCLGSRGTLNVSMS